MAADTKIYDDPVLCSSISIILQTLPQRLRIVKRGP